MATAAVEYRLLSRTCPRLNRSPLFRPRYTLTKRYGRGPCALDHSEPSMRLVQKATRTILALLAELVPIDASRSEHDHSEDREDSDRSDKKGEILERQENIEERIESE